LVSPVPAVAYASDALSSPGGPLQTLERTEELASLESSGGSPKRPRRRRSWLIVAGISAVLLITAGIAYAIGTSQSSSKTIVKTVSQPVGAAGASGATAKKCVQGVAPGSCNIDESKEQVPDQALTPAQHDQLAVELVAARAVAEKYPTVADAQKAGFLLAGRFAPQLGAHYIDVSAVNSFDPSHPGSFIYDGISPTSKLVGLMYLGGGVNAPEGFVGPNDHWHRHTNTCVVYGGGKINIPFAADSDVTKSMCDAQGGMFMRRTTWMVHAWVVPGYESPLGVFSHENPDLKCADGTSHTDALGFCQGT
jgi:hypothetical protein